MKRTVLFLTKEHYEWVLTQAGKRGCTIAQVIRDLIVAAMEGKHD